VGIDVPFDGGALVDACHEVVAANDLGDAYVRPLVFVGGPHIIFAHWLNPVHVAVAAFPWRGYKDRSGAAAVAAKLSPYRRPKALAELYKAKLCGHYLLSIVAFADASRTGYQQAIFLDEDDLVCEATGDNLFVVSNGELATPTAARPILLGLKRACVLELARDLGLRAVERDFGPAELAAADEVFTTGTASGILGVGSIDGTAIGDGGVGPVTRSLQERFAALATGLAADEHGWLEPVQAVRTR
jgi:branched-chain amino acid aminotransferase